MLLTAPQYARRGQVRTIVLAGSVIVLTAIGLLAAIAARGEMAGLPLYLLATLSVAGLTAWLWKDPVRGLYVLVAAAVLLETQLPSTVYPDDIGSNIYFFEDISTWTHIKGISVSVAELFMALAVLVWVLKAIAKRGPRFDKGSLMRPLALYGALVVFAELHGLVSGGDFKISLWEVRPQAYMLVCYILACNVVRTRRQVQTIIWIVLLGTGLKAVQGIYRYRVSLGGSLNSVESLFSHEQSFFFNLVIVLGAVSLLYGASRRMKSVLLVVVPLSVYADLLNQRRAATLALAVAVFVLLVVTVFVHKPGRRTAVWILLALAAFLPPYYLYYQNKGGSLAQPARAIASNFRPDVRDASSNLYRTNEDADIMATMKNSLSTTAFGYGFGKPMLTPYPLADISQAYVFWNIMPHNSILWIWMRMGTLGFAFFWFLIGTAIVQALRLMRRLQDAKLRGVALFIALAVIQEVIFGYLDLQWVSYRNLMLVGVLLALLSRLDVFSRQSMRRAAPLPLAEDRRDVPKVPAQQVSAPHLVSSGSRL